MANSFKHILETLEKLKAYIGNHESILSVYLDNSNRRSGKELSEDFQKLIKNELTSTQIQEVESEIEIIAAYLENDYDNKNHLSSTAFFAGKNMWEVANYDFQIKSQLFLSHTPNINPLIKIIEKDGRYLFVVVDREKAEIFTFYEGSLEDFTEIQDPGVPQKVKAKKGYLGQDTHVSRHIEDHLRRHLKKISETVDQFINGKAVQGVFIGGHKPLFGEMENLLSSHLQRNLKGTFVTELNIPRNELIQHGEKALERYLQLPHS